MVTVKSNRKKWTSDPNVLGDEQVAAFATGNENSLIQHYINFAIHRTCGTLEKYNNAARMVISNNAQQLLNYMANRKKHQALKLHEAFRTMSFGISSACRAGIASITNYLLDVDLKPLSNLEDAFLYMFKLEHKNLDMYTLLLHQDLDAETRTLVEYLVDRQESDIRCLECEIIRLKMQGMDERDHVLVYSCTN